MVDTLLNVLISGLKGNRTRRSQQPREVAYGDVVCVSGDVLKRYAIWTGENFILYGEDKSGRNIVHEESFRDFFAGDRVFCHLRISQRIRQTNGMETDVSRVLRGYAARKIVAAIGAGTKGKGISVLLAP